MNITELEMRVLDAVPGGYFKTKTMIAESTGEKLGTVTRTLRNLARKGLVKLEYGVGEYTGNLCGSGYVITSSGSRLTGAFGEGFAEKEMERIKALPEPEKKKSRSALERENAKLKEVAEQSVRSTALSITAAEAFTAGDMDTYNEIRPVADHAREMLTNSLAQCLKAGIIQPQP